MIQSNTLQDQIIATYIDQVFNKYDTDGNGTLDVKEMTVFFNDLFKSLNINTVVTDAQSEAAIKSIDENSDGMVSKEELFKAFKLMLNPYLYYDLAHKNQYSKVITTKDQTLVKGIKIKEIWIITTGNIPIRIWVHTTISLIKATTITKEWLKAIIQDISKE